jgi:hypothetical protein
MRVPDEKELKNSRFQDRSKRQTNPACPEYTLNGIEIKDDVRSKPRPLKTFIEGNHLLKTDDIDGAKEGWRRMARREYRNIMTTADIPGAQADTVKSSLVTERVTNPLTPVYNSLDGDPMPPLLRPLIPESLTDKPTLKPNMGGGVSTSTAAPAVAATPPQESVPAAAAAAAAAADPGPTVYTARSFAESFDNSSSSNANAYVGGGAARGVRLPPTTPGSRKTPSPAPAPAPSSGRVGANKIQSSSPSLAVLMPKLNLSKSPEQQQSSENIPTQISSARVSARAASARQEEIDMVRGL